MGNRMEWLVGVLNKASDAYYNTGDEIMSNKEYDAYYDELASLEKQTGIVLPDSPTKKVGATVTGKLPKEKHEKPALSLDKTKDRTELCEWLGDRKGVLSWKMDGLTVVLTYDNGRLTKAVTRGNGEIGEVITANARHFEGIPLEIADKRHIVVRGEAVISYEEFNRINNSLPEGEMPYKNPRNLASGTVRQLDDKVLLDRRVTVYAFEWVSGCDGIRSFKDRLDRLSAMGFNVVENVPVTKDTLTDSIEHFESVIKDNPFPSDGLVLMYDDTDEYDKLGTTGKYPKYGKAFKWQDETAETIIRDIEWSASRTGLINPVAVFDPVELEGTSVSRASVHNVSIVQELKLGIGDKVTVYKANMIIPQIAENLTKSSSVIIPDKCPVCGHETGIKGDNGSLSLYCTNPECMAKKTGRFEHFVKRDAMNIEGMATSTIETFINHHFLNSFADIYRLSEHKDEIISLDGFGKKAYENLIQAVEKSRKSAAARLLYAMGIQEIGRSASKAITAVCDDAIKLPDLTKDELMEIEGIGEIMADNYVLFFADEHNRKSYTDVLSYLDIEKEEKKQTSISGKTFVITGSVNHFTNRDELKTFIEKNGGKTSGSVSSKTDYLINNDAESGSSKNKKAKELGVNIITEDQFLALLR